MKIVDVVACIFAAQLCFFLGVGSVMQDCTQHKSFALGSIVYECKIREAINEQGVLHKRYALPPQEDIGVQRKSKVR